MSKACIIDKERMNLGVRNEKNERLRKACMAAMAMMLIIIAVLLRMTWCREEQGQQVRDENQKLKIQGVYYINGNSTKYDFNEDTKFHLSGKNTITIKGHLDQNVPANKMLLLHIDNLKLSIKINGNQVYSYGEIPEVDYAKSSGNVRDYFVTDGISTQDDIEITLSNFYTNHVNIAFERFIDNLSYGYDRNCVIANLRGKLFNSFVAVFIICMGILSMFFAIIAYRIEQPSDEMVVFAALCIVSGVWFFIDFQIENYLFPAPVSFL